MPKISVVVPIYKVEAYLPRCIDSILNQSFSDFELILVDDGSPDRCGEICEEYARRDGRIRVIHKENGGVGSARNAGLEKANGAYIMFCDSDDFLLADCLEFSVNTACLTGADIVCLDIREILETDCRRELPDPLIEEDAELVGEDLISLAYCSGKAFTNQVNAKLYRSSVLSGLRFDCALKFAEDVDFVFRAFENASHISLRAKKIYCYVRNEESVTISDKSLRIHLDTLKVLAEIFKNCRERGLRHLPMMGERLFIYLFSAYNALADSEKTDREARETVLAWRLYAKMAAPFSGVYGVKGRVWFFLYRHNFKLARRLRQRRAKSRKKH